MASAEKRRLRDDLHHGVGDDLRAWREADEILTGGVTADTSALASEVVAYAPKKLARADELTGPVAPVFEAKAAAAFACCP